MHPESTASLTRFQLEAWAILIITDNEPNPTVKPDYMAGVLERIDRMSDEELRDLISHPDNYPEGTPLHG